MIPIGTWVLHEACRQIKVWRQAGYEVPRVAVNVSAVQFAQTDFAEVVAHALAESMLDPYLLELELTESMLMGDYSNIAPQLVELRALGVAIAIDDFGTGYSSLSYLQRLPIDTLKIDQSFVRDIGPNPAETPNDVAIIKAITTMAHNLGMHVVAEGVETQGQFDFLYRVGCDGMQGYLLSAPLAAIEFEVCLGKAWNWIPNICGAHAPS